MHPAALLTLAAITLASCGPSDREVAVAAQRRELARLQARAARSARAVDLIAEERERIGKLRRQATAPLEDSLAYYHKSLAKERARIGGMEAGGRLEAALLSIRDDEQSIARLKADIAKAEKFHDDWLARRSAEIGAE